MDSKVLLTGYETRIVNHRKQSAADIMASRTMFRDVLKKCLGSEMEVVLADGSTGLVTVAEVMAAKRITYLLDNPDKIDFKEISAALGENKAVIEDQREDSKDIFRGITVGAEEEADGSGS